MSIVSVSAVGGGIFNRHVLGTPSTKHMPVAFGRNLPFDDRLTSNSRAQIYCAGKCRYNGCTAFSSSSTGTPVADRHTQGAYLLGVDTYRSYAVKSSVVLAIHDHRSEVMLNTTIRQQHSIRPDVFLLSQPSPIKSNTTIVTLVRIGTSHDPDYPLRLIHSLDTWGYVSDADLPKMPTWYPFTSKELVFPTPKISTLLLRQWTGNDDVYVRRMYGGGTGDFVQKLRFRTPAVTDSDGEGWELRTPFGLFLYHRDQNLPHKYMGYVSIGKTIKATVTAEVVKHIYSSPLGTYDQNTCTFTAPSGRTDTLKPRFGVKALSVRIDDVDALRAVPDGVEEALADALGMNLGKYTLDFYWPYLL